MSGGEAMADAELVLRLRGGEQAAFAELVRRHLREAHAYCFRLTGSVQEAEDLSQEGFVAAYRAIATFRGEASFRTWLYRILLNRHRDRVRSRRREDGRMERLEQDEGRRAVPRDDTAGREMAAEELQRVIRARIRELPERQREVLTLHVHQGLSYGEIGAILGCSYDDVKMCLSLARKKLKERLKDHL